MKKKSLILILFISIMMVGCLGRGNRSPIKQVTAFVISVPCASVGVGNECYEIAYQMMDTEEKQERKR